MFGDLSPKSLPLGRTYIVAMQEWTILEGNAEDDLSTTIRSLDELKLTMLFPVDILGRGFTYYYENWIKGLSIEEGEIRSQVQGADLYQVRFWKSGPKLIASCNCPYEAKCKHMAATLIAAMHKIQGE